MAERSQSTQLSWLVWALVVLIAGALIGLFGIYFSLSQEKREAFSTEGAKALMSLITVGVAGAIIKLLLDDRAYAIKQLDDERITIEQRQYEKRVRDDEKEERLQEFRINKIRRLTGGTNVLRLAPILIEAHRSAKTYNEQMRLIIDAGLELHLIRHETSAIGGEPNPAFPQWPQVSQNIKQMEQYIKSLSQEWINESKGLSEKQRRAEAPELGSDERRRQQSAIWDEISRLPSVADLLEGQGAQGQKTQFATGFIAPYNSAIGIMLRASMEARRQVDIGA